MTRLLDDDGLAREIAEATDNLQQMYVELDLLQVKIARQKRWLAGLIELSNVAEDSEPPIGLVTGITDACETAVLGTKEPISPAEVRDRILALGFPSQKNLLPSVHTVLKRLAESGRIKEVDGAYRPMTLHEQMQRSAMQSLERIRQSKSGKKRRFWK